MGNIVSIPPVPVPVIVAIRDVREESKWRYEQVNEGVPVFEVMQYGTGEFIEDGNFYIFINKDYDYMAVTRFDRCLLRSIKGTDESVLNELYSKYFPLIEEKLDEEDILKQEEDDLLDNLAVIIDSPIIPPPLPVGRLK